MRAALYFKHFKLTIHEHSRPFFFTDQSQKSKIVFNKKSLYDILYWLVISLSTGAFLISVYNLPIFDLGLNLLFLVVATIIFSTFTQLQIPRTKIHINVSDVLVFLALLTYGGEVGVMIAILETIVTSLTLRNRGVNIKTSTIVLNGALAGFSTFLTALVAQSLFGSITATASFADTSTMALMLCLMAVTQFLGNSIIIALFTSLKSDKNFWKTWYDYCLNGLVLYFICSMIAGLTLKLLYGVETVGILIVSVISFTVYFTYRRYTDDVKNSAEKAEKAERERAELAEKHIEELQHHILQQEETEKALRQSREKFKFAAYHDVLTSLPNRNQFVEQVRSYLEDMREDPNFSFTVLSLDLNRFKTVNESLGHKTGDKLIVSVARRLLHSVRADDFVARFSGDEFGIILTDISKEEDVVSCLKILTTHFKESFEIDERSIFTSFSIGVAIANQDYEAAEDIIRDAEIAMYQAKFREQKYEIFDPVMHAHAVSLLQVETDLRYAVERNEMVSFYQPIVCLQTMKVIGFEALMRWNHPKRGMVSPGEFIPVSESTGLIVPMTLWMLRESCRKLAKWSNASPENKSLMMSVNLSGKHFGQDDLVAQVKKIITEEGIDPKCLKLEITESAIMDNAESAITVLKQLKRIGVKLSIDDFGTGYSSLSYLHRFPIDTLKIDRSFVSAMETGTENGEIVRTVIALAKALNLTIIAEGIESIHQLHQLRILGCEYGQGFLFSRPIPVDQVEALLDDKGRWKNIIPDHKIPVIGQNRPPRVLQVGDLEN